MVVVMIVISALSQDWTTERRQVHQQLEVQKIGFLANLGLGLNKLGVTKITCSRCLVQCDVEIAGSGKLPGFHKVSIT